VVRQGGEGAASGEERSEEDVPKRASRAKPSRGGPRGWRNYCAHAGRWHSVQAEFASGRLARWRAIVMVRHGTTVVPRGCLVSSLRYIELLNSVRTELAETSLAQLLRHESSPSPEILLDRLAQAQMSRSALPTSVGLHGVARRPLRDRALETERNHQDDVDRSRTR